MDQFEPKQLSAKQIKNSDLSNVKARVTPEFFEQMHAVINSRNSSVQEAIVEGLQLWMGKEPPKKEEPRYSREQQMLIDQLFLFLDQAAAEDVRLLKSMLAANAQLIKAKEKIWAKQGLG